MPELEPRASEPAPALGRAVVVFAVGAALVLLTQRFAEPPSPVTPPPTPPEYYQRLTPVDAPRFENGVWIDAQSQPLETKP